MAFRVFSDVGSQSLFKLVGFASILSAYFADGQGISSCTYKPGTCSCLSNLGLIDLTPASKSTPYIFSDSVYLYLYYWDPCKDFTQGTTTAGGIQMALSGNTMDLGVHSKTSTDILNGYVRFNMISGDTVRESYVQCVCGPGDIFTFVKEDPSLIYNFIFTSNACCPTADPPDSTNTTSTISPGTIMVIVFFVLLVVYFVFGTIIQVAVRKSEGRERIPNIALWSAIPGLIRDGFIFTFTCGKRSSYIKM